MVTQVKGYTDSSNGLLSYATKSLSMLTHRQWDLVTFIWNQLHKKHCDIHLKPIIQEALQISIYEMSFQIAFL